MNDFDDLPPLMQEAMSPEFWASLSPEEQQARLLQPIETLHPDSLKAAKSEVAEHGTDPG